MTKLSNSAIIVPGLMKKLSNNVAHMCISWLLTCLNLLGFHRQIHVDCCFDHSKGCIQTHLYCVYWRWGSESARVTALVWLLVRERVEVIGRAGACPSGPILAGLRRTVFREKKVSPGDKSVSGATKVFQRKRKKLQDTESVSRQPKVPPKWRKCLQDEWVKFPGKIKRGCYHPRW